MGSVCVLWDWEVQGCSHPPLGVFLGSSLRDGLPWVDGFPWNLWVIFAIWSVSRWNWTWITGSKWHSPVCLRSSREDDWFCKPLECLFAMDDKYHSHWQRQWCANCDNICLTRLNRTNRANLSSWVSREKFIIKGRWI